MKKKIRVVLIFITAFLLGLEIFLYFDLDTNISVMFPASFVFALVISMLSGPVIHLYRMNFDEPYRKQYKHTKSRIHKKNPRQRIQNLTA